MGGFLNKPSSSGGGGNGGKSLRGRSGTNAVYRHQVLDEIARHVNLYELRHAFVEEGLLKEEDLAIDLGPPYKELSRQSERLEVIQEIFADERKIHAFQRSIQKSVGYGGHLGHDYIATLLDDTKPKFADESSIELSRRIHERMVSGMQKLVASIKPSLLYHVMVQKRLLTLDEFERFKDNRNFSDIEKNERLLALLVTKGPTAHLLFAQCLDETQQLYDCHHELCQMLTCGKDSLDIDAYHNPHHESDPEHPLSPLKVPDYLKGKEYHDRRSRFEACYHNGDWPALFEESKKCTDSKTPETVAIGYLELALGWIFQLNEREVMKNLQSAHKVIITELSDQSILYARHEYLHALLLRYLQRYAEASKKAETAIMILNPFEVGEDKAFAQYCYATSFVETLSPFCTDEDFDKARRMLITAIEYAKRAIDMDILVTYSQLQLARLYLGTTDSFLTVTDNLKRIKQSKSCLKELEKKLSRNKLHNTRFESLYYLRKSDYERSQGNMTSAMQSAQKAKNLATEASLPIEIRAAENRITYTQTVMDSIQSTDPYDAVVSGQKHVMLNSNPITLPPAKKTKTVE